MGEGVPLFGTPSLISAQTGLPLRTCGGQIAPAPSGRPAGCAIKLICPRLRISGRGFDRPYTLCLEARKGVPAFHPLDGTLSLFAHLSGGNASRSGFYGGQPYTARPLLSLRDISPALRGNLPAPPPHREHSV